MVRISDPRTDRKAEEAAFLRSRGWSQKTIATRLNTTQSNVSRLLKRAETVLDCYAEKPEFKPSAVSPQRLAELHRLEAPSLGALQQIGPTGGVRVRELRVVDRVTADSASGLFATELGRFGRAAAARVAELLGSAKVVGATWGSTLSAVVDGLDPYFRRPADPPVTFFPVCAEPERFMHSRESSSAIAGRLNTVVNADRGETLALTRIPAFIPRRFTGLRRKGILEMMKSSDSYGKIFGGRPSGGGAQGVPLVVRADTLLTSIGHSAHPMGFNNDELLSAGGIEDQPQRLQELVLGDIGGVLIRRPGLAPSDQRAVDDLSKWWTGLTYEALSTLACRSHVENTPGVVVIACGRNRDEILSELLRKGLVNQLIIDEEAHRALCDRLGIDPSGGSGK